METIILIGGTPEKWEEAKWKYDGHTILPLSGKTKKEMLQCLIWLCDSETKVVSLGRLSKFERDFVQMAENLGMAVSSDPQESQHKSQINVLYL